MRKTSDQLNMRNIWLISLVLPVVDYYLVMIGS